MLVNAEGSAVDTLCTCFTVCVFFETQATWLRLDKVTPHQCWNVCDWKTTERDQPSEARLSLPTCTQRKSGNLPTVAIAPSKRDTPPLFNLLSSSHKRSGTEDRTGHPYSCGTPCLNCFKFSKEADQPTQLRKTCHSLPSPSVTQDALIARTSHVSHPLRTFPGIRYPGPCDNFMPPLPSPNPAGRKRFCHQIHANQWHATPHCVRCLPDSHQEPHFRPSTLRFENHLR